MLEEFLFFLKEEFKCEDLPFREIEQLKKNETIDFCSEASKLPYLKEFDFVFSLIRHGFLKEVLLGEGKFGLYHRFPLGGHYGEQRNTDYGFILKALYILMKNFVVRDKLNEMNAYYKNIDNSLAITGITNVIISSQETKNYGIMTYLVIFLCDYKWANTDKDIIFDWRKVINHINKNLMDKEFYLKNEYSINLINSLNLDTKFILKENLI